jgi:uncharacterized Zn finger protein
MKPVTTLINLEEITGQASRSNLRLGKAIAEDGKFVLEKSNTYMQLVQVSHKGGQTRTVRVEATPKGLRWKCTCSARKDLFCEHCVALGLHIIAKANPSS